MNFNRFLHSVADAGMRMLRGRRKRLASDAGAEPDLVSLCEDLISIRGEALGTALACSVVEALGAMDDAHYPGFFALLVERFGVQHERLVHAIERYRGEPGARNAHRLYEAAEPLRQELFRRINIAPGGTATVVAMRAKLLELLPVRPEFVEIDADLRHLFRAWFNHGFLRLARIDWRTPAFILEKLIAYEAVHTMRGWSDLQRRLAADRRCFAFFHPAMEGEPLIFIEVALTRGLADSVQELLNGAVDARMQQEADSAIFYSISDCQAGLHGISFGNFLIKQVVLELQQELPGLRQFATLSPIPGFAAWLNARLEGGALDDAATKLVSGFDQTEGHEELRQRPLARERLMRLCAEYLVEAKRSAKPLDPVARFHLRNGASIGRLNWAADLSHRGIAQSAGIMVNYVYDLGLVEKRHEDYVNDGVVATHRDILKMLETEPS